MVGSAIFAEAVDLKQTEVSVTLDSKELAAGTSEATQPGWDAGVGMLDVVLLESETVVEKEMSVTDYHQFVVAMRQDDALVASFAEIELVAAVVYSTVVILE